MITIIILSLLAWYLIGVVSWLIGQKYLNGNVDVQDLLRSFIFGLLGLILTLILIIIYVSDKLSPWYNRVKHKKLF